MRPGGSAAALGSATGTTAAGANPGAEPRGRTAPPATERIRLLDVLRGVAIFGTLGTNVWLFAKVGGGGSGVFGGVPWWTSAGDFLTALAHFATNGKFLGLLTVLFGVGLEIQFRSARRRGLAWPARYLWRSALLLVEGFLHYLLVFEFDILMGYAVAAMVAAFLVDRSDRAIRRALWASGGVHVALFGSASALTIWASLSFGADASFSIHAPGAAEVYAHGSWWDQVLHRLENLPVYRIEPVAIVPMNVFLFLVGVRLMRSGAFSPDERGRLIRRKMLRWGLVLGVPLNGLLFVPHGLFELPARYLFAPILSLGYVGLVALATESGRFPWLSGRLAAVGRMALSCYVLQNVLASAIFYGWGLGLTGRVGAAGTLAVWAAICAALALFSDLWLRWFSQGPFEAAWKRLSSLPFGKEGSFPKGQH